MKSRLNLNCVILSFPAGVSLPYAGLGLFQGDQTVRETEKAAPLDTRGKEEAPSPMARKRTSPPQGRETPVGKLSIRYLKHECK